LDYLLGMDAGGTKTLCVIADTTGNVVSTGWGGCGNFQTTGRKGAQQEIQRSVDRALCLARIHPSEIAVAFYGIAGADRPKDFDTIRELLHPINPARTMYLENDTLIALRAGTKDGIGVGLISGTGTNAIGLNHSGKRTQVGGWGSPFLGDYGSAYDIAATALWRAQRGHDGRGEKTVLCDKFRAALGLQELIDICEWNFYDSYRPLEVASFAPLVFEAAGEGDAVALHILEKAGHAIALAALAVLRDLFRPQEKVPVILGGSVFQKGSHPAMIESLEKTVHKEYPHTDFVILDSDPVLGALFYASDKFHGSVQEEVVTNLKIQYHHQRNRSTHTAC